MAHQSARALLVAVVVCTRAAGAAAQMNTGEIAGVVRDASGAVLSGALVSATHQASGATVQRPTDADGRYFMPALRPGTWDLTAQLPGFAAQTRRGVVVEIGRTLTLEFTLGVQGLTEQVTVEPRSRRCCRSPRPRSATSSRTARSCRCR